MNGDLESDDDDDDTIELQQCTSQASATSPSATCSELSKSQLIFPSKPQLGSPGQVSENKSEYETGDLFTSTNFKKPGHRTKNYAKGEFIQKFSRTNSKSKTYITTFKPVGEPAQIFQCFDPVRARKPKICEVISLSSSDEESKPTTTNSKVSISRINNTATNVQINVPVLSSTNKVMQWQAKNQPVKDVDLDKANLGYCQLTDVRSLNDQARQQPQIPVQLSQLSSSSPSSLQFQPSPVPVVAIDDDARSGSSSSSLPSIKLVCSDQRKPFLPEKNSLSPKSTSLDCEIVGISAPNTKFKESVQQDCEIICIDNTMAKSVPRINENMLNDNSSSRPHPQVAVIKPRLKPSNPSEMNTLPSLTRMGNSQHPQTSSRIQTEFPNQVR